jgi:hypothetical protein
MNVTQANPTVNAAFFQPIAGLASQSSHARACPDFSDDDYLQCGLLRVLESSTSGRAFLQEHGARLNNSPSQANYFATLHSPRRGAVVADVNNDLRIMANQTLPDRLAGMAELAAYEVFAVDGHWHKAATHDPRHNGVKMSVGHFYSLNLRTHTLRQLAVGEGAHEHDLSVLKRLTPRGLRQEVPKGRRSLMIYDRAGIDFDYWKRCRHECAIYFLSRTKSNTVLSWEERRKWDASDPRNRGVQEDMQVKTRDGHSLRLICYVDPVAGKAYEFLTNEPDLPPGVLAELYRRRWDVEKVFDELKNKLGEKKAWATSAEAKQTQAHFLTITHNLLLLYEQALAVRHEVQNHAEDQRRSERLKEHQQLARKNGQLLSTLVSRVLSATQRSVKFIRWLREALRYQLAETIAVLRLKHLYATL